MSNRKPFNEDLGYRCSLRTPFGYVVLYDRKNGGDWIDGGERWVIAAYDHDESNLALLDVASEKLAREHMKDARAGLADWVLQEETQ